MRREAGSTVPARLSRAQLLVTQLLAALALGGCGGAPPPELTLRVRGHVEVALDSTGAAVPRFFGASLRPGLCLEPTADLDVTQWRLRLWLPGVAERPAVAAEPAVRLGRTLCFERALEGASLPDRSRQARLCAELEDGYDGTRWELPCQPVQVEAVPPALAELREAVRAVLADPTLALTARRERLQAVAERALAAGLPTLAVRVELILVDLERRQPAAELREQARSRLAALPAWLGQPAGAELAGQAAYQRAQLLSAHGADRAGAWAALAEAERRYRDVAHPLHFTVVARQAEILGALGAPREGRQRLAAALATCSAATCDPALLPSAHGELAWLTLLDGEASGADLAAAERLLRASLAEEASLLGAPLERANALANLAYLELRLGRDPGATLGQLRAQLAAQPGADLGAQRLARWAELLEGLSALGARRYESAARICGAAARSAGSDPLAAWALSCLGEALRGLERRDEAASAFAGCLAQHERTDPTQLGQSLPLGRSQRADDFYRAARLELERGEAAAAWALLLRLDRLALPERVSSSAGLLAAASEDDQEHARRRLLASAADLEVVDEPGLRAFWLEDRVWLLERSAAGAVRLVRSTPVARAELGAALELARRAQDPGAAGGVSVAEWRARFAGLARALVPEGGPGALADSGAGAASPPLRAYSLHGQLQQVPLPALPLAGADASWLADVALPVLRPALVRAAGPQATGPPTFLVDPLENLAAGARLAAHYRREIAAARVLYGGAASRAAFFAALPGASWLHLDAHGEYDEAFPELARLRLADGPVFLAELLSESSAGAELVNLSGCRTGAWPTTADSGLYGLAGLFARRGAAWVVATPALLDDRVAEAFNRTFVTQLGQRVEVVAAYARAHAELRRRYPVTAWASLSLLQGSKNLGPHSSASERGATAQSEAASSPR